jgi:hypothetical protein
VTQLPVANKEGGEKEEEEKEEESMQFEEKAPTGEGQK